MNAISSTLKDEIKKTKESKKKEKFKFIGAILLTNIMVASMMMPSTKTEAITKKNTKIIHPDYQIMVLPMQVMVSDNLEDATETPVTLLSSDKKIIALKAYLHEEIAGSRGSNDSQFKIEISNSDVAKIGLAASVGVIAVPYVESKKIKSIKRGSKYEVSL